MPWCKWVRVSCLRTADKIRWRDISLPQLDGRSGGEECHPSRLGGSIDAIVLELVWKAVLSQQR